MLKKLLTILMMPIYFVMSFLSLVLPGSKTGGKEPRAAAAAESAVTARAMLAPAPGTYAATEDFTGVLSNDFFTGYDPAGITVDPAKNYYLLMAAAAPAGRAIQVNGTTPGSGLKISYLKHNVAWTFSIEYVNSTQFILRSIVSGLVIAPPGGTTADTALQLEAYVPGAAYQLWRKQNGTYMGYQNIINVNSGKSLDYSSGIWQRTSSTAGTQMFELNPIGAAELADPFIPALAGHASWAKNAIRYPQEGKLTPAGPIHIQWFQDASIGEVAYYELVFDRGTPVYVLPTGALLMGYEWYTTSVANHNVEIVAVLADGERVATDTRYFPVTKKGIGFGNLTRIPDMNVAWHWNWIAMPNAGQPSHIQFEPMVWSAASGATAADMGIAGLYAKGFRNVMGFNEPDLASQANMTVALATSLWPQFEGTGLRLGSPVTCGNAAGFTNWLTPFMNAKGSTIGFTNFHHYTTTGSAANATAVFNTLKAQRHGKPMWITEFAVTGSAINGSKTYAQVSAYMTQMLKELDADPVVERYSWYTFADPSEGTYGCSALFYPNTGALTPLGELYKSLGLPAGTLGSAWQVSFDYQGATGRNAIPGKIVRANAANAASTYGSLPEPIKAGYTFNGWFTSASGGTKVTAASTASLSGPQTLYAQWTAITYTVTVTNGTVNGTGSFLAGAGVAIIADGPADGMRFAGWNITPPDLEFTGLPGNILDASKPVCTFKMPASNVTATATYEPIPTFTVTLTNGSFLGGGTGVYEEDDTVTLLADAPPEGKQFTGWTITPNVAFLNGTTSSDYLVRFTMPGDDVTAAANYEDILYSVTVTGGTGGGDYAEGAVVTLTPNAAPSGKRFKQWNISPEVTFTDGASPTSWLAKFTMPDDDVTATAVFEDITYTVTFDQGYGVGDTTYTAKTAIYNGTVSLPAEPSRAQDAEYTYAFAGWYTLIDGGGTEFTGATPVTGDIRIYAKWTPTARTYTVTFDQGYGVGDTTYTTKTAIYNGTVSLPAEPSRAQDAEYTYAFAGWYTLIDGGGTEFTGATPVMGNIRIYAKWNPTEIPKIKYTLNVINGSGSGDCEEDEIAVIIADPAPSGKVFDKWTVTGGGSVTNENSAATTFTMPAGPATVTATYKEAPVGQTARLVSKNGIIIIDEYLHYIYGFGPGVTWSDMMANYLRIEGDGIAAPATQGETYVGTGFQLRFFPDTKVNPEDYVVYTFVLFGDTGDGWVNASDAAECLNMIGAHPTEITPLVFAMAFNNDMDLYVAPTADTRTIISNYAKGNAYFDFGDYAAMRYRVVKIWFESHGG